MRVETSEIDLFPLLMIAIPFSRFAESEGKRNLEELIESRKSMMERLRKLEATKAKGLRSQKDENGEDVDTAIGQIKGGIELTNCQVRP